MLRSSFHQWNNDTPCGSNSCNRFHQSSILFCSPIPSAQFRIKVIEKSLL